jgi:uncharacterized membrane protein YgcG
MSRLGLVVAAVAGLALPVALALAVYVASAGTLAEPVEGTGLPSERIARPSATTTAAKPAAGRPAATRERDESGPCDEAEHANDPRCTGAGTEDDDRSEEPSSSDSSGESSNSGRGSDDSSGDDEDKSGPGGGSSGSSGSDSSGSGSGDD